MTQKHDGIISVNELENSSNSICWKKLTQIFWKWCNHRPTVFTDVSCIRIFYRNKEFAQI